MMNFDKGLSLLHKYILENDKFPEYNTEYEECQLGKWYSDILSGKIILSKRQQRVLFESGIALRSKSFSKDDDIIRSTTVNLNTVEKDIKLINDLMPIVENAVRELQGLYAYLDQFEINHLSNRYGVLNKTNSAIFNLLLEFMYENDRAPEINEKYDNVAVGKYLDEIIRSNIKISSDELTALQNMGIIDLEVVKINSFIKYIINNNYNLISNDLIRFGVDYGYSINIIYNEIKQKYENGELIEKNIQALLPILNTKTVNDLDTALSIIYRSIKRYNTKAIIFDGYLVDDAYNFTEQNIKVIESITYQQFSIICSIGMYDRINNKVKLSLVKSYHNKYNKLPEKFDGYIYKAYLDLKNASDTDIINQLKRMGAVYIIDNTEIGMSQLREYMNKFKTIPARGVIYQNYNLTDFVNKIRSNKIKDLTTEDKKFIEDNYVTVKINQDTRIEYLREFIDEYGRLPEKNDIFRGIRIYAMVKYPLRKYKEGTLSQYEIEEYRDLGIINDR